MNDKPSKLDQIRALGQPEIGRAYTRASGKIATEAEIAALRARVASVTVTDKKVTVTRKRSGKALTPAEKQRAYRERRKGK